MFLRHIAFGLRDYHDDLRGIFKEVKYDISSQHPSISRVPEIQSRDHVDIFEVLD